MRFLMLQAGCMSSNWLHGIYNQAMHMIFNLLTSLKPYPKNSSVKYHLQHTLNDKTAYPPYKELHIKHK